MSPEMAEVARIAAASSAPPRPGRLEERLASWLFLVLSPSVGKPRAPEPPAELGPWSTFRFPAAASAGELTATWYPAAGAARGAVLLSHPWTQWGQAWFHRHGRVEALRAAGYHAMTFDLSGFGASRRRPRRFYDLDVQAALTALRQRAGDLPLHFWGVSSGGYWAHPVLSREEIVVGAVFEDVATHLIGWAQRMAPYGWPGYVAFRRALTRAYRYFDLRRHAPFLRTRSVAYVGGGRDPGIPASETEELARLAGAACLLVDDAGHLESIKTANAEVIGLALTTFERATA